MTHTTTDSDARIERFRKNIRTLARRMTKDRATAADLEQEMICCLIALPPGQAPAWYLSRVGDHAKKYWGRRIVDAPLDRSGRPILARQTIAVGGLAELNHLYNRAA